MDPDNGLGGTTPNHLGQQLAHSGDVWLIAIAALSSSSDSNAATLDEVLSHDRDGRQAAERRKRCPEQKHVDQPGAHGSCLEQKSTDCAGQGNQSERRDKAGPCGYCDADCEQGATPSRSG